MRTGRPKADLLLSVEERSQLESFARSRSLPAALSARARMVLSSADGQLNSAIAERLQLIKATVGKWRARLLSDALLVFMTMCVRASRARSMTNAWRS